MRPALVAAAALLAYGAWRMRDDPAEAGTADAPDAGGWVGDAMSTLQRALGLWRAPPQYAPLIAAAEARYGLPPRMLERLLYQESRYRADIISGATRSPVGALGIAQFMPATAAEMKINPLDPAQAIDAAGRYLAQLFKRFGTWREALASYNWGMGNVQRKGLDLAPRETRAYYSEILADVNTANGTTYV